MERAVKERLVGAAVLMAAAIILIPEMLSGPERNTAEPLAQSTTRGETPIKTYTIDLNQPPGTPATSAAMDERAPPPEEASQAGAEPATAAQVNPEPAQAATAAASATPSPLDAETAAAPVDRANGSAVDVPAPAVVEPPTGPVRAQEAPSPRPLASGSSGPTSGTWAVQLGSFSKQATAERLVKDMRGKGHDAFVMPVRSGGAMLYRVRIGPMKDRASAEATLRAVKASMAAAAIVAHP